MGCTHHTATSAKSTTDVLTNSVPDINLFKHTKTIQLANVEIQTTEEIPSEKNQIVINCENQNLYKEFSKIGSGGLSTCFSFINCNNGQLIVVKKALNEKLAKKEFDILNDIHHSNIAHVYHLNKSNIYMEYCTGMELELFCNKIGPMNEVIISHFLLQITDAIHYLHFEKNIIHCDLKPKNIMIDEFGNVKIIDFGSAIHLSKDTEIKITSINANIEFTAIYAAPELIIGTRTITNVVDVWSMGCIIIKMITSNEPWSEMNFINNSSALFHIAKDNACPAISSPFPTTIEFNDMLQRCIMRDPLKRINTKQMLLHKFLSKQRV